MLQYIYENFTSHASSCESWLAVGDGIGEMMLPPIFFAFCSCGAGGGKGKSKSEKLWCRFATDFYMEMAREAGIYNLSLTEAIKGI
jgi:hypothetical protein